jgi:cell division protein DivIC
MSFNNLKNNRIFKILTNTFVLIFIPFLIWMLFFDENSYLVHRKFNQKIKELESTISFYQMKISEDKATIHKLSDSLQLERFAREQYLMKKENEDIYIIAFDTIKK